MIRLWIALLDEEDEEDDSVGDVDRAESAGLGEDGSTS